MPFEYAYKSLPIFLNARDLFTPLRRLVRWLLDADYHNIFIIDNDSTYPPLVDYLNNPPARVQVIRLGCNVGHTAIWDAGILDHLQINTPFVYSDPDIVPIEECPPHLMEFLLDVLLAFPDRRKVGLGLVIDDLPDHNKFKRDVIKWEGQYWKHKLASRVYDAPVDTTFALYRPHSQYDISGVRSGFPYLGRHLPWYENTAAPSEEQVYYVQHARPGLTNWSLPELPAGLKAMIDAA